MLYKSYFKEVETRTMIAVGLFGNLLSNLLTYFFAKRWNLAVGISDQFFLYSTDVVFQVILEIFLVLPIMVLFAKITPKKIEGSMYALLTGTMDFCQQVIQPVIASLFNDIFTHVDKNHLKGYADLLLFAVILGIFSFLALPLIPTSSQIQKFRDERIQK